MTSDHGSNPTLQYPNPTDVTGTTLDFIYVSAPMDAGVVFQSGVTTISMQAQLSEYDATDNVDRCIVGIRILNRAATTVQATLLAVGNYGPTSEFTDPTVTNFRNKTCADGDTLTSDYTTVDGDRVVMEFGYEVSTTGTTPQAGYFNNSDTAPNIACAVNETDTTECFGWIEFSNTFTMQAHDRVAATFSLNRTRAIPMDSVVAFDAGWETTTGAFRRRLDPNVNGSYWVLNSFVALTEDNSTAEGVHTQYVSVPMVAGIEFDDATTRVTSSISMDESNADDNVNRCVIGLRVVTEDGSTVQATLLSVASRDPTRAEIGDSLYDTRICADSVFVETDYETVAGDRLVFEVGCGTTSSTTTTSCSLKTGDSNNQRPGTNPPDPLLPCAAGAVSINCTGWLDIWGITFVAHDPNPGPTRLYFPEAMSVSFPTSITPDADWSATNEKQWRRLSDVKRGSHTTVGQSVDVAEDTSDDEIDRQYVSLPMVAGTVFSKGWTTVKGQAMFQNLIFADLNIRLSASIRILASDLTTVRTELLSADMYFLDNVSVTNAPFTPSTLTNDVIAPPHTPVDTDYTTVTGDRLVIELGGRTSAANTTPQFRLLYGDSATDCVELNTTSTTACAPWIEFSNDIQFEDFTDVRTLPPWIFKFL